MEVMTMGLKKIYVAPQDDPAATTMPANNTASETNWVDLGDVYQDSATLTDADGTTTSHKSETSAKEIVLYKPGDTTIELQLMDPDMEQLKRYFGGEITTGTGSKKTWTRPRNYSSKCFAIFIIPEDGNALQCPVAYIAPRFNITYNAEGIMLVDMTITLSGNVVITEDFAGNGPIYVA